jgi:hypothetical protein
LLQVIYGCTAQTVNITEQCLSKHFILNSQVLHSMFTQKIQRLTWKTIGTYWIHLRRDYYFVCITLQRGDLLHFPTRIGKSSVILLRIQFNIALHYIEQKTFQSEKLHNHPDVDFDAFLYKLFNTELSIYQEQTGWSLRQDLTI